MTDIQWDEKQIPLYYPSYLKCNIKCNRIITLKVVIISFFVYHNKVSNDNFKRRFACAGEPTVNLYLSITTAILFWLTLTALLMLFLWAEGKKVQVKKRL